MMRMSSFASYAFNKSHAACYAVVAYQTAYLKCHYPCQFMAALLTSVLDNTNKVIQYTAECSRLGIRLLAPDINESDVGFTVQGGDIRFGLLALKNVGRNLIEAVVRARTLNGPYQAACMIFCKRMHGTEINRRAVESLVKAGAFDSFAPSRRASLEALEGILKSVENDARRNLDGQMDLFGAFFRRRNAEAKSYTIPEKEEYLGIPFCKMEKEVSGLYLSGHPLDQYREEIEHLASHKVSQLTGEDARRHDGEQVVIVCSIVRIKTINTPFRRHDGLSYGGRPHRHHGSSGVSQNASSLCRQRAGKCGGCHSRARVLQRGRGQQVVGRPYFACG